MLKNRSNNGELTESFATSQTIYIPNSQSRSDPISRTFIGEEYSSIYIKHKNRARQFERELNTREAASAWENVLKFSCRTNQDTKNAADAFEKAEQYEKAFKTYFSLINKEVTNDNIDNIRYFIYFLADTMRIKCHILLPEEEKNVLNILQFLQSESVKKFIQEYRLMSDLDQMHLSTIHKKIPSSNNE